VPTPLGKADEPIVWSDDLDAWVVWQYREVVAVLKDKRFSAAAGGLAHREAAMPTTADVSAARQHVATSVAKPLGWARRQMQSIAESRCTALADERGFDLQRDLLRPSCHRLSMVLTGTQAGGTEAQRLLDCAQSVFAVEGLDDRSEANDAMMALSNHFSRRLTQPQQAPGQDFISLFATGAYPVHVLLAPAIQLFVGLSTSLPLLLGNALWTLLSDAEFAGQYLENPTDAVGEIMRCAGPVQLIFRMTLEEATIGDHRFRRGDRLALMIGHANRDPAVFDDPDLLKPGRVGPAHLGFGRGGHFCLGAPIVRHALEVLPHAVLTRFPEIEIDTTEVRWGGSRTLRGITSMPVRVAP